MIKRYAIQDNRLVEAAQGQALVLIEPDASERAMLQEQFMLDDYDFASVLDQEEIPRIDLTNGRLLLIWKTPESLSITESAELGVTVVGLTLLKDRIAFTRATGDLTFTDREYRMVKDVPDVMLAYLLRTVRHFVGHLRVIRQIGEELEKKVTVSMENKHLLQMFSLGESLVYYVDALEGNAAVLGKLRTIGAQCGFQAGHLELLDDIILENAQAARQAGIYMKVLSGLMDARGTIVNNNMNVLLKNLTLINIVFLPLNLIASIGGMSEWSMMTQGLDWRAAYALFSLGMVGLGWLTWIFMKKFIERTPVSAAKTSATRRPPKN